MLIDSHAHLDFYNDPAPVLARAHAAGVAQVLAIGIGNGPATMHRALEIANQHPSVWASAGIHPQEAHQATPAALAALARLAEDPRCIAIGEIGLDYYHLANPAIDLQQQAFAAQLKIAAQVRKPILIHCRTSEFANPAAKQKYGSADAFADLMHLIAEHWTHTPLPQEGAGIMHCFSGTPAEASQALAAGFYLSFAGNVTYPKSTGIQQAAAEAPDDRILVETDSPFLAPVPVRGSQNEPGNTIHTAAYLAHLRHTTPEHIAEITTRNFRKLFPTTL